MNLSDTQKNILKKLIENGKVRISELAAQEKITVATIHNYKTILEGIKIVYERGYISLHSKAEGFPFLAEKLNRNRALREFAAAYALKHFGPAPDDFVFFDGGTTQYLLFKRLLDTKPVGLSMITNNPLIINEAFADHSITDGNRVFVVGGKLDCLRASFYGSHTASSLNVKELRHIQIDICYLGVVGILTDGKLVIGNDEELPQKRLLIEKSKRIVVIIDGSKINKRSWTHVGDIGSIKRSGKEIYIVISINESDNATHLPTITHLRNSFGEESIIVLYVPSEQICSVEAKNGQTLDSRFNRAN